MNANKVPEAMQIKDAEITASQPKNEVNVNDVAITWSIKYPLIKLKTAVAINPPINAPKIASNKKGKRKAILEAPTSLIIPSSLLLAYAVTRIVFPTSKEVTTNIAAANPKR